MSWLLLCTLAGAEDKWVGVSLLLPQGADQVVMTAQIDFGQPSVLVDDGSIQWDYPNDGEWFGLVLPTQRVSLLTLQGAIDGVPVFHQESIGTPMVLDAPAYVVTFRARREDAGWSVDRIITPAQLGQPGRSGSGVGAVAEDAGLSATALYMAWGALVLVLTAAALVRSAIARAQSELGTR